MKADGDARELDAQWFSEAIPRPGAKWLPPPSLRGVQDWWVSPEAQKLAKRATKTVPVEAMVDADVVEFFRGQGGDYRRRMEAALFAFVAYQKCEAAEAGARKACGQRLRRMRRQAGLTQGALAQATGLQPFDISAMERGQSLISKVAARRLAKAVGGDWRLLLVPDGLLQARE